MRRNLKLKNKLVTLVIIFILQICLATALYSNKKNAGAYTSQEDILKFESNLVEKILLEDSERKATLILEKQNDLWILPNYFNFPASLPKIEKFLKKFSTIKKGWPVATTNTTAKRFKVEKDNFVKKVIFSFKNNDTKIILLGTSPGFKKIHSRIPDQDEIFAIPFSSYEAETDPEKWMNKNFLNTKRNEIQSVEMPSFSLFIKEGKLVVNNLSKNEQIVEEEAQNLLSKVANLSFIGILGVKKSYDYRQLKPKLVYSLKKKDSNKIIFTFYQQEGDNDFILEVSSHDFFFKVDKYEVEKLQELKRDRLVKLKKEK